MMLKTFEDPNIEKAFLEMKSAGANLASAVFDRLHAESPENIAAIRKSLQSGLAEIRLTARYTGPSIGVSDLEMRLHYLSGESHLIGLFS